MLASKIIEALQTAVAANGGEDVQVHAVNSGDCYEEDAVDVLGVQVHANLNQSAEVNEFGVYLTVGG